MRAVFAVSALVVAAVAAVFAVDLAAAYELRDPGSFARRQSPQSGFVLLDANYLAPAQCYAVVATKPGAPPGARARSGVAAVTIIVARQSGSCPNVPKVVRELTAVPVSTAALDLQIFFVSPSGARLKIELVAIQEY